MLKNFNKIKAVIIDDEESSRDKCYELINEYFKDFHVSVADGVSSGIELINRTMPQIVFLDIDMPDGTGFDLLNGLDFLNFKVIFITAHQEHAIKAIKYSALDYILKPYSADELITATNNALFEITTENNKLKIETFLSNFKNQSNEHKKLVLNTADNIYIVDINDVIRCESDNNYTVFHLSDRKPITMSKTLKEYEAILSSDIFIRVHRSHLININFLERYEKKNSGQVVMKDGSFVPVSIRKKEQLLEMLSRI